VPEFREYFDGPIYLDQGKHFFKAIGNTWVGWTHFFNPSVWSNLWRMSSKGAIQGHMKGEGRLMGGSLVIRRGDAGVELLFKETSWGTHAPEEQLSKAIGAISKL